MKIQVLSDLHLEVKPYTMWQNPQAEVVILAGDIIALGNQAKKLYHLENLIKSINAPIVYIFGNHECYNFGNLDENIKIVKTLEQKYSHFHFLNNESWVFQDVEFIGSTLWSDFDLADKMFSKKGNLSPIQSKMDFCSRIPFAINDFNQILTSKGLITVRDVISFNNESRDFIKKAVKENKQHKKVVVTHFCPSEKCIHPQYAGSWLNPYFACNCESLMDGVPLWIFGHTHSSFDFKINDTRLLCNPRGYDKENKGKYDSQLVVEV